MTLAHEAMSVAVLLIICSSPIYETLPCVDCQTPHRRNQLDSRL